MYYGFIMTHIRHIYTQTRLTSQTLIHT
ncbi:unnamed protein product [Larinioides sclopetarius]|uniref:Uncharacterized protein n=1 Tax=Larinioides sclopetarius TaxID=280406 RepID=A0AAV1ZQK0_9ARAC